MKHDKVAADADPLPDYDPVSLTRQRHDGWTAERQRTFLVALAETGCISEACRLSGITARSAHRLRRHPLGKRFAEAWDQALRYATGGLMTLAYERAVRGGVRETWRNGELVAETREPSDKMLIFVLSHLASGQQFEGSPWQMMQRGTTGAALQFAGDLRALKDCDVAADPLDASDFLPSPPAPTGPTSAPFDLDLGRNDSLVVR